jgi:nucleotide-binding universal stress UspA family protein
MERLKMLIPTDFSVQAEYAYLMVKKLEEKTPVDIHFLHVMNVPDTVTMNAGGNIQTCGEIDIAYLIQQKEIAERKLDNLKVIYGEGITCHFLLGKVTDVILNFAKTNHFDLVVMGTKGTTGLKEKLSGSETQMIARRSAIPVLSVMCDRSELDVKNILLVHNFNRPAREDLQWMHKLIRLFNAKLHLLQVISGEIAVEKEQVEANMKTFGALNNFTAYECHLIRDKEVEKGVLHFNRENSMDLVCIGTHGKGGLFHHSATERLINHLYKPIISFHLN